MQTRERENELMDNPMLDRAEHAAALQGLARLNAASGAARIVWQPIRRLWQDRFAIISGERGQRDHMSYAAAHSIRPLRILDLACGGGDVSLGLSAAASNAGIKVQVDGCDISQTAVALAQERAKRAQTNSKFFHCDVLKDELPAGYDVIVSSLFLHHLDEFQAKGLLEKMSQSAQHMVVVNDLVRSDLSLSLVTFASHVLSSSRVVHFDARASVKAAFTPRELKEIADSCGLYGAEIRERFPCRMLLTWRKAADA